jgi:hypothetical protein
VGHPCRGRPRVIRTASVGTQTGFSEINLDGRIRPLDDDTATWQSIYLGRFGPDRGACPRAEPGTMQPCTAPPGAGSGALRAASSGGADLLQWRRTGKCR